MEDKILKLLEEKLKPAVGCTEPIAIALASGMARKYSKGREVSSIKVIVSGNILKNAFAVIIPGTNKAGIDLATALGVISYKNADKGLEILSDVSSEDILKAEDLISRGSIEISLADIDKVLYIEIILKTDKDEVKVIIEDEHTNITLIEVNGKSVKKVDEDSVLSDSGEDYNWFTIDAIWDFVNRVDIGKLGKIREAIKLNDDISKEGLSGTYGLEVGKTTKKRIEIGYLGEDLVNFSSMRTAAGSDARMSGALMPVMSNTGSGNQGITSTIPVLAVGEKLGLDEDRILRGVTLSSLITIYIKLRFGVLSALCGASVAATGASCGITYLLGGGLNELGKAVNNVLGNVSGMLCDGAKPGCAFKVSTCTSTAVNSALLAVDDKGIKGSEGIVSNSIEETIDNFCKLSKEVSSKVDESILDIMINK